MRWRSVAHARLHFGLFAPQVSTGRAFGGTGLMLERPVFEVAAETAPMWQFAGPQAERVERVVNAALASTLFADREVPPQRLHVMQAIPAHHGLGSGTALSLAVGQLLAQASGVKADAITLANALGRGRRSAIGIHGFTSGGFLVDGGKPVGHHGVAPLLWRCDFPEAWRLLVCQPNQHRAAICGVAEESAFTHLPETPSSQIQVLTNLTLRGLMPALVEQDFPAFAAALDEYNRCAGACYAAVQGGAFQEGFARALVAQLHGFGVPAAGQSSWGPSVFALLPDAEHAAFIRRQVLDAHPAGAIQAEITSACNYGAVLGPA